MQPADLAQVRALIEHAPMMLRRSGLGARCDYVNATWLAFTGRAVDQELGDGWVAGAHPDDRKVCHASYLEHFERRQTFEMEYRLRRHDGVYRYVLERGAPYEVTSGTFAGFLSSCIDVDDRRRHDADSGADEFFDMALDSLCVVGFDGYFKRVSPSWTNTLGWTAAELMSRPSNDFLHPDDLDGVRAARERLQAGLPMLVLVNRYRCKDGTYRWFEWRSVAHIERRLVYAAARDVTEQRAARRVLDELNESLTTTLNSITDGVIAIGADTAIVRMNPVAATLTGWTSAAASGRPLDEVFHVVDPDTGIEGARMVERTLPERIADFAAHTLLVARDGTRLPIASRYAPMRNAEGTVSGAVLVFRDLTAEKHAEAARDLLQRQLILADRMASVGTLAAGVAHEINNPLAYVVSNLEMLIEELPRLETVSSGQLAEWAEMATEARQGAERIRKIVRGLKTFSRAEDERRAVIDVRPVLELSINMAFNEIRHRARLVKDYGEIPMVEADDARLGQVFINLLVNAAHAIPEGDCDGNEVRIVTSTDAAGRAVVEIRDTGSGIPAGVIGRVFDPFFTTKAVGVGTGLGLSICHNIVGSMHGEITARNREGRGASFRVALPGVVRHLPEPAATSRAEHAAQPRRAAVLIVDDERAVGVTLGRVLKDHDVTIVTTAREALALIVAGTPFDVVLSDLMMPEMSGMELYGELARLRPEAAERMVFVTGGAFTPAANAFFDRIPNERIDKPFDAAAVRALVLRFVT